MGIKCDDTIRENEKKYIENYKKEQIAKWKKANGDKKKAKKPRK